MYLLGLSFRLSRLSFLSVATCLGIATLATLPQRASAQANLTFSGGSGSPITLTLTSPVSYTMTATSTPGLAPWFVFYSRLD
jgi:hypothetical protein